MPSIQENNCNKPDIPPSPAPRVVPKYCSVLKNPEADTLKQYLKMYIYIWTKNDYAFWMYPIEFYDDSIYGYIWTGDAWEPARIYYNNIDSFY